MASKSKYSKEQEQELLSYDKLDTDLEREAFIVAFATKWPDKNKRSIIAKLSKMTIYVSKPKVSSVTQGVPETKLQLVERLKVKYNWTEYHLIGLDKTPKLTLLLMLK